MDQVFSLTYWVPFLRPGLNIPGDFSSGSFPRPDAAPVEHSRLRRSLKLATVDGLFAEVITALTQGSVLTAWALFVGGNTLFIGVLAAMPFISQLFHLPAAWLTAMFGRKRVTFWSVLVARQAFWLLVPL